MLIDLSFAQTSTPTRSRRPSLSRRASRRSLRTRRSTSGPTSCVTEDGILLRPGQSSSPASVCLPPQKPNSTLYVFPLSPPASSHPSLLPPKSHALLLPFPSSASASVVSREPSVLVVSPAGELRFWDSLSAALVDGGTRFVASDAIGSLLADGESVDGLWSAGDGLGAVVTGDKGGLWKVGISYPGGRAQVDVVPFPRATSAGFLGFFRSSASSSNARGSAAENQPTLVLPLENGRLLILTPQAVLQTFSLSSASRPPVLASSTPLLPAVLAALQADEREGVELSLEMHDLRPLSPAGEIGILVSFEETGMLEGGRRSAIIGLTAGSQGEVKVSRVIESSTRIVRRKRQDTWFARLHADETLPSLPPGP